MCACEAASTTYAKCECGLTHVFLGAYSLLNEISKLVGRSLLYLRALMCVGEEDDVVHRHEHACGSEK